jgi:hypothetical protein
MENMEYAKMKESRSARGAWIETVMKFEYRPASAVALRTDLPTTFSPALGGHFASAQTGYLVRFFHSEQKESENRGTV